MLILGGGGGIEGPDALARVVLCAEGRQLGSCGRRVAYLKDEGWF